MMHFSLFQAKDADKTSQISYAIIGGNEHQLFEMDKHSGEITVTDPRGLDMSEVNADFVNLIIQVNNDKGTSLCAKSFNGQNRCWVRFVFELNHSIALKNIWTIL